MCNKYSKCKCNKYNKCECNKSKFLWKDEQTLLFINSGIEQIKNLNNNLNDIIGFLQDIKDKDLYYFLIKKNNLALYAN